MTNDPKQDKASQQSVSNLGGGWQPIEAAPKDGTTVDVWLAPRDDDGFPLTPCRVPSVFFDEGVWRKQTAAGTSIRVWETNSHITHWMPLPAPPEA